MANVTFNGPSKLILVNNGITSLDVGIDLYSDWKEWLLIGNNTQFLPAFRTIGGDPTVAGQKVAPYFFLLNGWKIKPYSGNHVLSIVGNLFSEDGSSPFVSADGGVNVLIVSSTSSSATLVETGVSGLTPSESDLLTTIPNRVWEEPIAVGSLISFGDYVSKKLLSTAKFLGLK